MIELPKPDSIVIVQISREGGVAYIPALASARSYMLGQCPDGLRSYIIQAVQNAAEQASPTPDLKRPDARFFRVELLCTRDSPVPTRSSYVFDVPETYAPQELVELWKGNAPHHA